MNHNHVLVTGTVATRPQRRAFNESVDVTTFRLAVNSRRLDDRGEWVDGRTTWVTVECWRSLARHAAVSLAVGNRVLVHGKLISSEWESENGRRSKVLIEAAGIGPDLTFGAATFVRGAQGAAAGEAEPGEDGDDDDTADDPGDAGAAAPSWFSPAGEAEDTAPIQIDPLRDREGSPVGV